MFITSAIEPAEKRIAAPVINMGMIRSGSGRSPGDATPAAPDVANVPESAMDWLPMKGNAALLLVKPKPGDVRD
jgi:hypothetical protein